MYWLLGIVAILALLIIRSRFSKRGRICRFIAAAQIAKNRGDFESSDENLRQASLTVETLKDESLRNEFRCDLALMAIHGAYWKGDHGNAEHLAHQAVDMFKSIDPTDSKGRLCAVHGFLGDIHLDNDRIDLAAEEFRAAATIAEQCQVAPAVIFPLQRLADALLEEGKREAAGEVLTRCAELEKAFFAAQPVRDGERVASMIDPDRSLLSGDFPTAEKLFEEKVRFFLSPAGSSLGVDVLRYQLHLATAQQSQGRMEQARATLASAYDAAERQFGPRHPRVARLRRKLAALAEVSAR